MAGQFWLSMACPLFFNMITQFCNGWFPDNERTLATALCGISIPLGNLLAFLMSGFMFQGIKEANPQEARHLVDRMIWTQNIWITAITVPYFILLREKPALDVPLTARPEASNLSYFQKLRLALKNRNYVLLSVTYALMIGMNTAFGISVDPIFGPLGFTNFDIAVLGVCVVAGGVCSSMVSGFLLKAYRKYLVMTRVSCFGCAALLFAAIITFQTGDKKLISLNMILAAVFLVPIIPIGINFANELTFPLDETVTQGSMLMLSQLFGFILANICIVLA